MKNSEFDFEGEGSDACWSRVLEPLGRTPWQIALVVTGGGSGAVAHCFRRAGASRNFVEAVIPYSNEALEKYLGQRLAVGSASLETALQMAAIAFERAADLGHRPREHAAGIALVAALPTTPLRRGTDRIHVAMHTDGGSVSWSTELVKGEHTRSSAEQVADSMVCGALATLV